MAIKGCARQMIVVNAGRGDVFETAYFIVRADAGGVGQTDMLREANRIVPESCFATGRPRGGWLRWFFTGVLAGAAAVGLAWLIVSLL